MLKLPGGVLLNTLSSYGRFALTGVAFLVLTPFVIRELGPEGYGLWTLVISTVGFFGVLDLGFGTAIVKFVGESRGLGSVARRNEVLSTVLALYCVISLLALLGIIPVVENFARWFDVPESASGVAETALWLIALRSVVLALPLSVFRGALFGTERILAVNLIQAVSVLFYAGGAVIALSAGHGIVGLAVANLAAMLLEHALYVLAAFWSLEDLRISVRLVRISHIGEVGSFSLYSMVGLVAGLVLLRSDPVLVSLFLPLSAVAVYGVALKIAEQGLVLTKQFANVLTPRFARLGGSEDAPRLRQAFQGASRLALLPAAPVFVTVAFLGGDLLTLWVGPEFSEGRWALMVLVGATLVSAPQLIASSMLAMIGHHRFIAFAAGTALVLNLGISLLLVGPLGLLGVALGTLIATLLVDAFLVVPRALRVNSIPYPDYLRTLGAALVPPTLAQASVLFLAVRAFPPDARALVLMLEIGLGALVFLGVGWRTALLPSERARVRSAIRRVTPSLGDAALEGAGS